MAEYRRKTEKTQAIAERKVKKSAKKAIRKTHPATLAVALLFLIFGIAAGAFFALRLSENDRFVLKGETAVSVRAGTAFTYREEGAEAVSFGRDVSEKVTAVTDLQKDAGGNYVIPTDKPGVYTITYTVECFKFGEKSPNGATKRIRTFTVTE